jgi:hypothetical protein
MKQCIRVTFGFPAVLFSKTIAMRGSHPLHTIAVTF